VCLRADSSSRKPTLKVSHSPCSCGPKFQFSELLPCSRPVLFEARPVVGPLSYRTRRRRN
jgi:hypothetical protein